jgi:hypothetical protein
MKKQLFHFKVGPTGGGPPTLEIEIGPPGPWVRKWAKEIGIALWDVAKMLGILGGIIFWFLFLAAVCLDCAGELS